MKRDLAILFCAALLIALFGTTIHAQTPDAAHVNAAKAASTKPGSTQSWQELSYVFDRECRPAGAGRGGRGAQAQEAIGKNVPLEPGEQKKLVETPHDEWYVKPAKVFDNLYYIGTKTESTWALTTSAGIILLNTNFEWVTPHLLDQMKDVGLDPANIKYAIITHAHSDQYWGVNGLKKRVPAARVVMSEADWNTTANDNSPDRVRPKKDIVATDGTKVTLGDTTVTIYLTPGPSAGTTSIIFRVKDGNQTHMAALWGGTGANMIRSGVRNFPDAKTMLTTQTAAMKHFIDAQKAANVDTLITVHAALDKTFDKIAAKKPGVPNPFVDKSLAERFSTILYECAQAKLARLGS